MKGMGSFESEGAPPPLPRPSSALKIAGGSSDPQLSVRKRPYIIFASSRSRSPMLSTVPVTPDTSANLSKDQATIKKSTVAGLSRHQLLGSLPTDGSPGSSSLSKLPQRSTNSNLHVPPTHSRPSSTVSEADCEYFCLPTIYLLTLPPRPINGWRSREGETKAT